MRPVSRGRPRRLVGASALILALSLSSTAVLAYADLLPQHLDLGFDFDLGLFEDAAPTGLPHVAQKIALGGPLSIVAFGSSSTEGIGASTPAAAYPARLEAGLRRALPHLGSKITVANRGIGGEAVDEMLARLDRDVIAPRPDLVIWQTGSNDALRGVSLDHFREATEAALERIRAAGIDVVLMEPQWCPALDATPGADRFRDAVRTLGAELGVPVIRRSDLMRDWIGQGRLTRTELFASDGLHMADGGYALLAEAAQDAVLDGAEAAPVALAEAGTD
ncbi:MULTISPECIES: SGNH/GDSL hydrolase family protein [Methylorubrum]|uniref:SGNH/GDSL hydrolase family protein n=1 Tax=Methylorubrum TaxID=2282523 RepID=UPI00209C7079|nr:MULTISPECIES: GDSL-type esterase/lipase family protein [Methylorubrum]MCP1549209.1 lysophospholipase L1-like esterase [Methylorubrum zatmanii]MCP1554178.1 lysophospholipase L1-like esterase [Methylorubrum extorquens]MCP1579511.1 lysophospholipase L1-like esterase [Methylorubrum extorquens]